MSYSVIGFAIHRKCSCSCKRCCFESNPNCKEKLDIKRIKEYILESNEVDTIKRITFTGGEPFMEFENLLNLVDFAKKNSKKEAITCVSNGFWATSLKETEEKIKLLKEKGLTSISLSYDNYHVKHVPAQNIKNILNTAYRYAVHTSLSMVKIKNELVGNLLDDLGSSVYHSTIQIGPCQPDGNSKNYFSDDQFDRSVSARNLRCAYSGNLAISYDGMIYPCCSPEIFSTGMKIGSFYDLSLKEALKKINQNTLLHLLRNYNMDVLCEIAQNKLNITLHVSVVNSC